METSNIIKQAKADIFKELYSIINFYIKKGAKPASLKKYYKSNKRFSELLDDIKNKGINLVKDEDEYKKLVREILNDMLDDFIAKEKDQKESKNMKHIKEFNSFEEKNESFASVLGITVGAIFIMNFISKLILKYLKNKQDKVDKQLALKFLTLLKQAKQFTSTLYQKGVAVSDKLPINDFGDRYYIRLNTNQGNVDLRFMKKDKILKIDYPNQTELKINLSDEEYAEFLSLME